MNKYVLKIVFFVCCICSTIHVYAQFGDHQLIAHRGGVVNDTLEENSLASLMEAGKQGYWMVEIDTRLTKDSVLVAHHDRDLSRYFGVEKQVQDLHWDELSQMRSHGGNTVAKLETLLDLCQDMGLEVMIDLKILGEHPSIFQQLVVMLSERNLQQQALIIPTAEATDFFRDKIKISCSRAQIESYMTRDDFSPDHYYLFTNPSAEDYQWATDLGIQVVGVINYRGRDELDYPGMADYLKGVGVRYIQLDSRFDHFFKKRPAQKCAVQ